MKAVFFDTHGGPEVLRCGEVPDPVIKPGHVRVDVHAASLNHIDLFLRRGLPGVQIPLPHIPGCDAAGIVSELGAGVEGVSVGDRVLMNPSISCGHCEYCARGDSSLCLSYQLIGESTPGTCCEQIVIPADNAIVFPDRLSFEEAASLPLVFVTAWRMLITRGGLRAGESVLVLGGSAGVGIACIQIARCAGARVFAAASSDEKLALCGELGADVLIHYGREDFVRRVKKETGKRGVDVVVDYVGADTWVDSLRCLARGGRLLTCGATTGFDPKTDLRHIFFRQLQIIGSTMGSKYDLLSALRYVFAGEMRPVVARVFGFEEEAAEAHRAMEARELLGKAVLKVR